MNRYRQHPRFTNDRLVHHWPAEPYEGAELRRFAFSSCSRKVLRSYITRDVAEVTCPACIAALAAFTVACLSDPKPRKICPACGWSDGIDPADPTQCHRCGETFEAAS